MPDLALDGQLAAENAVLPAENAGWWTENAVLRAEHEETGRMLAALTQRVAELERRLGCDSSNSVSAAVIGCAVVEAAGEEALVAQEVGAQARQAAGRVVVLAEPHRRCRGHAGDRAAALPAL